MMNDFTEYGVLDVIAQWEYIAGELNKDKACNFCWKFFAPYTSKRANIIKDDGKCCVYIILKREGSNSFGSNLDFDNDKGYYGKKESFESYTLDFVIASKEGINNYNELQPNDVQNSRHAEIFEPLRKCIQSKLITEICNHIPLTSWSGKYLYDQDDEIYYGLKINVTQRFYE